MQRSVLVAVALGPLAACMPHHGAGAEQTIDASGSTFQQAFQELTIEAFTADHAEARINYGGGGSGKGRQDFADQVVDFACTDAPFEPADVGEVKGGEFFYIPNLLGAITVSYHLDVPALRLSPEVLAGIFQRDVTRWDDPAIAADNPGVALPDLAIVVVRRADGSGTTANFTKFLTLAAPGTWRLSSGPTVEWSADTQAGTGNGGVAQLVKSTPGAIGYVDYSDARASGLRFAAIRNRAGAYVEPTLAATSAAGDGIEVQPDLLFTALNAKGPGAYPITAQSWCLIYAHQPSKAKGEALVAYFTYMLTDAQALVPDIDFAPIPASLRARGLAQLEKVQVPPS